MRLNKELRGQNNKEERYGIQRGVGQLLENDFPRQEIDSRPLPVKSKDSGSLSNRFTFKITVSPNFDTVQQKGTALGGSPLLVHVDAPTELHEKRKIK